MIPTLMPEVRDYEPVEALDGGDDGLDFYRRVIEEAPDHIKDDGLLVFEIGDDQGSAVTALLADSKFLIRLKSLRIVPAATAWASL